jgi:glutathione S-transferase
LKLYNSIGPNPRVVKMFLAEKGLNPPRVDVNLMAGENRQEAHLARNPAGQMPSLETDSGQHISEITAICEYIDEKHPNPPLIGTTPEERAETRMWVRRIDLNICEPMANGFRYAEGARLFEGRIRLIPEAAPGLKTLTQERLAWLDGLMAGKTWVCGDRFTLADIMLFVFVEFGAQVGQPMSGDCKNIAAWMERVRARPSAEASNA